MNVVVVSETCVVVVTVVQLVVVTLVVDVVVVVIDTYEGATNKMLDVKSPFGIPVIVMI